MKDLNYIPTDKLLDNNHYLHHLIYQTPTTYSYDPVGNRNPGSLVYDVANRLLDDGTYTYTYNDNGNLTQKQNKSTLETTNYTYNVENQLVSVDSGPLTVDYTYDGLGRRIEKNVNGTITRYVYDNEDILAEYDGTNTLQAKYLHGPGVDEPLRMERGGQLYFYHADGLGSIAAITNNTGAVVRTYQYDSFGNIVNQTGTLANPFTYTGREYDVESGLYYYRARYYDARVGRFLQEDPVGYLAGLNLYTYVNNNPITWIDPWGLCKIKTGWWPKWLDYFVPGYRKYGGPSRVGLGEPEDLMDVAFQKHDLGYKTGQLKQADLILLYDLANLPKNPIKWGKGVNVVYAVMYRAGAYTIFSARLVIIDIGRGF